MKDPTKNKPFALKYVRYWVQLRNKNNRKIIRVMKDTTEKARSELLSFAVADVQVIDDHKQVKMWLVNKDRPEASVFVTFAQTSPKTYSVLVSREHARNNHTWAKDVAAPCGVAHQLIKGNSEAENKPMVYYEEIWSNPKVKQRILTSTLTTKHKLYALLNEIHLSSWEAWMKEWIDEFKGPEELAYLACRYKHAEAMKHSGYTIQQIQHLFPTYSVTAITPPFGGAVPLSKRVPLVVAASTAGAASMGAKAETKAAPPSIWVILEKVVESKALVEKSVGALDTSVT